MSPRTSAVDLPSILVPLTFRKSSSATAAAPLTSSATTKTSPASIPRSTCVVTAEDGLYSTIIPLSGVLKPLAGLGIASMSPRTSEADRPITVLPLEFIFKKSLFETPPANVGTLPSALPKVSVACLPSTAVSSDCNAVFTDTLSAIVVPVKALKLTSPEATPRTVRLLLIKPVIVVAKLPSSAIAAASSFNVSNAAGAPSKTAST